MKMFITLSTLIVANVSLAAIKGSQLEARHQDLIENAIYSECGLNGVVTEVSNAAVVRRVDQGIQDVSYTTILNVRVGVDQYKFEDHAVSIKSDYSDVYDHTAKNWGIYSVSAVQCQ